MTKHKLFFALACASVLGVSACAHEAWQLPDTAHPADPAAQSGSFTPLSSLQRYRASEDETDPAASTSLESEDEAEPDESSAHQHGEHMETSQ